MSPHSPLLRRRFLQALGLAAGAGAWRPIPLRAAQATEEKPRLRFVQINDLHVQAPDVAATIRTRYAKVNEKARWLIDEINRMPRVEFVLGIGDLIHGSVLEQLPKDLSEFVKISSALRVPFYPGMGNHEVVQRQGDPRFEKAYRDVYGNERVNYTFEAGGLRFIMLNNSGASGIPAAVARERNGWLREVLNSSRRQAKIVCCHIPLVPVREEAVLARSFGFTTYIAHDADLLAQVDEHAESIIAVLSGHLHLTGVVERKGVHHISISGTASYPSDYAQFDVFTDRIVMRVRELPAHFSQAGPSIHGSPRHPENFTDATHPTADVYQTGRADERSLVLHLS